MRRRTRWARVAGAAAAATAVIAACGNDDAELTGTATTEAAPATDPEPPVDLDSEPTEETISIGETVWFNGFTFEIDEVEVMGHSFGTGATLTITGTVTNLTTVAESVPSGSVRLVLPGVEEEGVHAPGQPLEPGESEAFEWQTSVPDGSDVADAVLAFGPESEVRAQVALGPGDETRTNAPIELEAPEPFTVEEVEVTVEAVELHVDRAYTHDRNAPRLDGYAYLWISGTMRNDGAEPVRAPSFRLWSPDGEDHVQNSVISVDGSLQLGVPTEFGFRYEIAFDSQGTFELVPTGGFGEQPVVAQIEVPPIE